MKTVKEMKPGVKYPGYGFINDYNEFQFTPSEVGSRAGQKKLVKEGTDYSVYTTKRKVLIHFNIDRRLSKLERISQMFRLVDNIVKIFKEYEI